VFRQSRFATPPGACELVLVRHGESEPLVEGNPFPLVGGHGDPELAPEGRAQAERVGERMSREPITAIYVTTLRRTHQTAAPLAERLGMTPVVEPDLREVHLGDWEGELFRQKVAEGDPVVLEMFQQQRWDLIPGSESGEMFTARVGAGIRRIAAAHPDQRVVVVAHGGTIGEALSQATGSRPWAFVGADNGSISRLVVTADRWILRGFNDTVHLSGL
jgi:probable phosphoglycerate mutase